MNELSLSEMVGGFTEEPRRRSRRGSERRKKKRRRRTFVMLFFGLALVGVLAAGAWLGLKPLLSQFNQPDDYPGPGTGEVQVVIPPGSSGQAIGVVLQKSDVVMTVKGFINAFNDNPSSSSIQAGTYKLKHQMKASDAVTALLSDSSRQLSRVTLKEGVRAADLPALIAAKTKIPLADLQKAIKSPAALGLPPEAKGDPEGWLFPSTYDIEPDTTAAGLLHSMVAKTVALLDAKGIAAADRRSTLIKASLVQAEAKNAQDFPKVARVFDNRLAKKMRLQLDTTVHYATKRFSVATTIKDTQFPSPYNTYLVPGLPVGAIDNPGEQAIDATINPTPGPWLYFVATNPDTGLTEYATTPAEFAVIKAKFDKWSREHPGK